MIKIGLSGANGRMGSSLQELIQNDERFSLSAVFSRAQKLDNWNPDKVEVVLDFSLPEAFQDIYDWCKAYKKPLLSGTTGKGTLETFKAHQNDFPFMYSGNYSLGVSALIKSLQSFTKLGQNINIRIEETHHTKKIDSPSGTALKIKQNIQNVFEDKAIAIDSIREGDVLGQHKVFLSTEEEEIVLTHNALTRNVFAKGALNASAWLVSQESGRYALEDFLSNF